MKSARSAATEWAQFVLFIAQLYTSIYENVEGDEMSDEMINQARFLSFGTEEMIFNHTLCNFCMVSEKCLQLMKIRHLINLLQFLRSFLRWFVESRIFNHYIQLNFDSFKS